MSELVDIAGIIERLLKADNILILCHKNPDGDTLGAAGALLNALQKLGKTAAVICSDPIHERYAYMGIKEFNNEFETEYIIAVDIAGIQLFGDKIAEYANKVDLCIDHHGSNSGYASEMFLDEKASATCEIMFDVVNALGVKIDKQMADCLYTGISTDTGCFKFSSVTARTHVVAALLMDLGADIETLNDLLFENKSKQRMAIEQFAMQTLEYHYADKCALICLTLDQIEASGVDMSDLEGITSMPRAIEGVWVGITMRQQVSGSFKISVRTKVGLEATAIVAGLGGGGHKQAAGCEIFGGLDYAKAAILAEVDRVFNEKHTKKNEEEEKNG